MSETVWKPHIIGHRGASGLAPENTLPSFSVAEEMGLPGAELDVHLTADGHLVVIHDHTVDRTTDGTGRVDEMTLAQVRALDAAALWMPQFRGTRIPTLDEILGRYGRRFRWEIELKIDERVDIAALVRETVEVIDRHDGRRHVQLTSFAPSALAECGTVAPDIRRRLIVGRQTTDEIERAVKTAVDLGCAAIGVHQLRLDPEVVAAVRRTGLSLTGWQGNAPEELERLYDARVDGFTSDWPDIALAWLRERGIEPTVVR